MSVFVVLYLLWQAAVPLSYYVRADVDEERFRWRMISGVWLLHRKCTPSVVESVAVGGAADAPLLRREVDLARTLHTSLILQLRRNQRLVVQKFLRKRCKGDPSVTEVEFIRTCAVASLSRMPPVHLGLDCRSGAFAGPRVRP